MKIMVSLLFINQEIKFQLQKTSIAKKLIFSIGFSAMLGAAAQNVGIGNPSPNEKLDVTGNINVTGTIKANGVDGTAGQVLMKNNSGVFSWGDVAQYKNVVGFKAGVNKNVDTSYSWSVPAGLTKIFVECWGGGGGGAYGGGGGGGGYAAVQWSVLSGAIMNIVIGSGGSGAKSAAGYGSPGHSTTVATVIIGTTRLFAQGGGGATPNRSGSGGRFGSNMSYLFVYGQSGTAGEGNSETFGQYSSSSFRAAIKFGAGGEGGNTTYTQKNGGFRVINTSPVFITESSAGLEGTEPGGGGGGGINFPDSDFSYYGGPGLVIIHY